MARTRKCAECGSEEEMRWLALHPSGVPVYSLHGKARGVNKGEIPMLTELVELEKKIQQHQKIVMFLPESLM